MLWNLFKRSKSRSGKIHSSSRHFRPGVETLEDRSVPAVIIVTGTGDTVNFLDGVVTLREALIAANTNRAAGDAPAGEPGLDHIHFSIGSGVQTIALTAELPTITERVTIDGTTQPGFVDSPLVELTKAANGPSRGLLLDDRLCTIKGLVLNRFTTAIVLNVRANETVIVGNFIGLDVTGTMPLAPLVSDGIIVGSTRNTIGGVDASSRNVITGYQTGIRLGGVGVNRVQGNFIGTDVSGTLDITSPSMSGTGILVTQSSGNFIGGTAAGSGNLISGNQTGIALRGSHNHVQGNFIGTDVTGTLGLGNGSYGILCEGIRDTIGGTAVGAGNLISGNQFGLRISGKGTVVKGNLIGTDSSGMLPLGNVRDGISFINATNSLIGGSIPQAANTIAYNGSVGVTVATGSNNAIRRNSIFRNGVIGIDLWDEDPAGDVPTQNDELDLDTGLGNRAQNFPVLYHVFYDQSAITVSGVLHSRPNRAYFIDLYADSVGSLAESGQGEKFLRTIVVKTDVNGDALFDIFAPGFLPADYFLTATATPVAPAPFGDTSEFSPLLAIEDPNGAMAAGLAATAASADASVVTEAPPPAGRLASDQTTRPAIHPHTYRPRAGHSRAGLAAAARAGHGHPGLLRWFR